MRVQVYTDFDGTVSEKDTLVHLLDKYHGAGWLEIERRVEDGSLSEMEGLQEEIALLDLPFQTALESVLEEVALDSAFVKFAHYCKERDWPLGILSGGLRPLILPMLEKAGIPELPLHCNDLGFLEDGRWKVLPAESPRIRGLCNHCKSWWLQESRLPLIYIGDGTTDRCPAERADLLFAKGGLARWCEEEGLEHVPFETFDDILLWLDSLAGETWLDTLTAP
ncbi:MAG: MtnX-like HAD-IB family phosphatase [Candidatus Krumholzibacteria bacterium]|nr:MtnX-like HAD-IB family phosphatase [Candidatus Krumholzibacteria bacterium]MDP6669116.1 MtnX-like HAD-IB family phosphatase [Candidatus Krumholzibacteria bacterium]MDP7021985.1 MtnX-like HAD-IB family phosphatase [Candidatus Krumholzibacteria bacterium]